MYVCGRCNITKLNRFAVFPPNSDDLLNVTRGKNDPVTKPILGDYVFIDPRQEHALDYMELDLVDTFFFVPTAALGGRDWGRADYTIRILGLNARDALVHARRSAYGSYRARLSEYHIKKLRGANDAELALLASGIASLGHPTVWHEMKCQHQLHPELTGLFNHVPEALGW